MRPFVRLVWKEGRQLLRPRYVLPIVLLPALLVAMGQGFGGFADELEETPAVGIVDRDGDAYGRVVVETVHDEAEVVYEGTDVPPERALAATTDEGGSAVLVIPAEFTERIRSDRRATIRIYARVESVGFVGLASSAKVDALVDAAEHEITLQVTGASEVELDPVESSHTTYIEDRRLDVPPAAVSATFVSQFVFVPLIVMLAIMFSGQMVMNSMASETENKTLETLLSMPIPRHHIVASKLLGGSIVGLAAAAVYTLGLAFAQLSVRMGAGTAITLGPVDYLLIGVSLFFALVGTLALSLCLGIFADNQQGAQMLLLPLSGLALVPLFATMFADFDSFGLPVQALLFAIPFTHPIIAPKRLLFGDVGIVLAGIGYEVLFAVGTVALAIELFRSDRPITGDAGWLDRAIELVQR